MESQNDKKTEQARTKRNKELLLSQLKKTPVVQIACEKAGVARATYYRWRKSDKKFTKAADEAMLEGILFMNDFAESQLLSAIKDGKFPATKYWLTHHHPSYATKIELKHAISDPEEKLTKRQEEILKEALKMPKIKKIRNVENEKDK